MPNSNILLSWKAPEFIKQQKTQLWDIGIAIITGLFILWGILKPDITLIILAGLGGGLLWHFGKQDPKETMFSIRTDGIQINHLFYSYQRLNSFWIFHEPPHLTELVLRTKRSITPLVHLNLGPVDPAEVRKILKEHLSEKHEPYPLYHIVGHIIGY